MPLTSRQVYAIRKQRQRTEAARGAAREALRVASVGALVGIGFIDIVWSNDTGKAYHPACRPFVPAGRLGTIDLSVEPDDHTACGHCGVTLNPTPRTV